LIQVRPLEISGIGDGDHLCRDPKALQAVSTFDSRGYK
jgi:hypothetical protein